LLIYLYFVEFVLHKFFNSLIVQSFKIIFWIGRKWQEWQIGIGFGFDPFILYDCLIFDKLHYHALIGNKLISDGLELPREDVFISNQQTVKNDFALLPVFFWIRA